MRRRRIFRSCAIRRFAAGDPFTRAERRRLREPEAPTDLRVERRRKDTEDFFFPRLAAAERLPPFLPARFAAPICMASVPFASADV